MSLDRPATSPARAVLRRCARLATLCAASLVAAGAVLIGLLMLGEHLDRDNSRIQAQLTQVRTDLEAVRSRLMLARGSGEHYAELERSGLIGPSQREAWAQSLLDAVRARGFAGAPSYSLLTPEPYRSAAGAGPTGGADLPGLASTAPGAPPALPGLAATTPAGTAGALGAIEVLEHRLDFQLSAAHEVDVLHILAHLQASHPGTMQGQRCELESPGEQGLKASCSARFLHVQRADMGKGTPGEAVRTGGGSARPAPGAVDIAQAGTLPSPGRLLFTPAERLEIDRLRRGGSATVAAPAVERPAPQPQRLDGVIATRANLRTAIINGEWSAVPATRGAGGGSATPPLAGPGGLRVGEVRQGDETRDLVPEGSVVRGPSRRNLAPASGPPDLRSASPAPAPAPALGAGRTAAP